MKKLLIIPILFICIYSYGQLVPVANAYASTLADLRALIPQTSETVTIVGLTTITDGNGGLYSWNPTSTATDDGFVTIAATGITTGRWIRVGNGNTIKGNVIFSGVLGTSFYTVNYAQGTLPFTPIGVILTPRTSTGSSGFYISSITSTGFTIVYNTTLLSLLGSLAGTNNISYDYVVIKQ